MAQVSNSVKDQARKTLIAQTSDALYGKLKNEKLMGVSKEVAIEILKERITKGKFKGDMSIFEAGSSTPLKKIDAASEKAVDKKTEKKTAAKKPAEKKERVKRESKREKEYPDFKLKFKPGQKVKFTPFRQTKELTGEVITSYPVNRKRTGEPIEAVKVRVGKNVYEKNASALEKI